MKFEEGMRVEVSSDERGYEGAYYAAEVVEYLGSDRYLVEYLTLRTSDYKQALREEAESRHIRPCPATKLRLNRYRQFEVVDCWYNEGWWSGEVSKVLGGHNYEIHFPSTLEMLEFTHGDLRPHEEWIDGQWVKTSTCKEQTGASNSMLLENTEKLLSDTSGKRLEFKFHEGMNVEIKHEIPGYHGCFFRATIIGSLPNEYYAVQYLNWRTADGKDFLKQEIHASCIRPYPPIVSKDAYYLHDLVDAWHCDQWQRGWVTRVFGDSKYEVYFNDSKETFILSHCDMRPHDEWQDGTWVVSSIRHSVR
uniref:Agenet domain-containing protein n=1 Tax=Kalanchoe fedtschenkoi TaxID=63787 RepID=A0A7N0UDA6_KALFE